jgi:hypothetical protein
MTIHHLFYIYVLFVPISTTQTFTLFSTIKMKEKGMMKYVVMILVIVLLCCYGVAHVNSQRVPALFVFGDSLVDVGNNNHLSTMAKSNFYPYGIDYNGGSTGRFSNGKSLIDFIGKL